MRWAKEIKRLVVMTYYDAHVCFIFGCLHVLQGFVAGSGVKKPKGGLFGSGES